MHDPISDMLTRIRNGQQAKHEYISCTSSKIKEKILEVLKEEGFILDYTVAPLDNNLSQLTVKLKYYQGKPVISKIMRKSRPGLRCYRSAKELKPVAGFGIAILSTSKGVMTDKQARAQAVGGEIICEVA